MYESEIVETVNRQVNQELRQWYTAKVEQIAALLVEKSQFQATQIQRLEMEYTIGQLSLEMPEEVLSK